MGEPNWANRTLFHGDNLDFLRSMNSETVHLIATDPPFNKGRDFHSTPDSLAAGAKFQDRWKWERDTHESWHDAIQNDYPAAWAVIDWSRMTYGDDMGAFLCFMGVRLMEMRRILRDDGGVYLHCDPTASHYLKTLMDAIFGRKQFRNELTWRRATAHNDANRYGAITDHILYYAKGQRPYWNGAAIASPKTAEQLRASYPKPDDRGWYRSGDLTGAGTSSGDSGVAWRQYDVHAKGRHWAVPKSGGYAEYIERTFIEGYRDIEDIHERLDALDEAGLIHHPKRGFWPGLKRYEEADTGIPPQNLILEPIGFTNYSAKQGEYTGYTTQKPLALYERFILASSREGDIVLDPFCGCATTPIAAERLGRQWVGMDLWDGAHGQVIQRLEQEGLAAPQPTAGRLLTFGDVTYTTEPPERTDDGEEAAPELRLTSQRALDRWQRLTRKEITDHLVEAQGGDVEGVICGGCGRKLEREFMQLDHILPRSDRGENFITNRILLCQPCNRRKSDRFTLRGLMRENKKAGWMRDQGLARIAQESAKARAERLRDELR